MFVKRTLQDCHNVAAKKGGRCLSIEYKNSKVKMLWECSVGHQWEANFNNIKDGETWCPECCGNKPNTLEDCHNLANIKGGKCLSVDYINSGTYYVWECSKGHQWKATYDKVQQGHWCPECYGNKPKTLQDCHDLAAQKGGKCLSLEYQNAFIKMIWKCKEGHQWEAIYSNVYKGQWCPECGHLRRAKNSNNSGILFHWKTNEELVWKASWERKVIDYLNHNYINFWWQPTNFTTPFKTKTGKFSTYRPDFYLPDSDIWIEIKGWMRELSLQKWLWFHKTYPNSELWDKKKLKELGIL